MKILSEKFIVDSIILPSVNLDFAKKLLCYPSVQVIQTDYYRKSFTAMEK